MVNRQRVVIPENIRQRGTGKQLDRKDAIVFDFMPVLLGDQFRTNDILSRQLFREQPVSAPFMLSNSAYTKLGIRHLEKGQITPALESYKIALYNQT